MKAMTSEEKTKKKANNRKVAEAEVNAKAMKKNYELKPTFRLAFLGLLTAIMFIMAFTPLGYLKTPVLSITFMTIPVIIAAIILKPLDAAIIGGIFGLTSFIAALNGSSALTSALLQINPWLTALLCFVPRILEGFLGAVVFRGLRKIDKTKFISYAVTSLAVPLMNTLFFMGTLFLFFYNAEPIRAIAEKNGADNIFTLLFAMAGVNALIEAGVCFLIGTAITKALAVVASKTRMYA